MAKAPRPGIGARIEAADAASQVLVLTLKGETYRLGIGAISMDDRALIRSNMKAPLEAFLETGSFGLDSLFVIWWLARRASGSPNLSYAEAKDQFPTGLTGADVDLSLEESDGDSPEA